MLEALKFYVSRVYSFAQRLSTISWIILKLFSRN